MSDDRAEYGDGADRLKVTSPRLDNDEIALTAVGRREVLGLGDNSGRVKQTTSSRRAHAEQKVGLDDSEQVTLLADGGVQQTTECENCGKQRYTFEACNHCGNVHWEDD